MNTRLASRCQAQDLKFFFKGDIAHCDCVLNVCAGFDISKSGNLIQRFLLQYRRKPVARILSEYTNIYIKMKRKVTLSCSVMIHFIVLLYLIRYK